VREPEEDNAPPTTTDSNQNQPPTFTHLVDTLTTNDHHIKTLIQHIPNDWTGYYAIVTLITKKQLITKRLGGTQRGRQPPIVPTSYHHIVPTTHCYRHTIPRSTSLRHLHGHHNLAAHHPKCLPRPNSTPPTIPPDHHIQHTS
jgi:hypothetical protein